MLLTTTLLAALTLAQTADTTFAVDRDSRLQVNNHAGRITVATWDRNAIRVSAHGAREGSGVRVEQSGRTVRIRQQTRRGPTTMDLDLTVPAWLPLDLSGVSTDITVRGSAAAVSAESVEGIVDIDGGVGLVTVRAVDGDVRVVGTRGRVEVNAIDGQVQLEHIVGEVTVESVDGDITLDGVNGAVVQASTVDGNIDFRGPIQANGRYSLGTHDGDITVTPVGPVNALVSVATFSGDFVSDVPVTISRTRHGGQRFSFTLGSGGARLSLESFDGVIRLNTPGR